MLKYDIYQSIYCKPEDNNNNNNNNNDNDNHNDDDNVVKLHLVQFTPARLFLFKFPFICQNDYFQWNKKKLGYVMRQDFLIWSM